MSLRDLESTQFDIKKIRAVLPDDCSAILYDTLKKDKRHRSDIFKNLRGLVVLYEGEIDGRQQGHYVTLIPKKTHIEYFSSLGNSPNHESTILGIENTAFKRLLGKNYKYSRAKLQRDRYDVNDCGLWAIARCYLSKWPLQKFQKFFSRREHITGPDDKVSLMTYLLIAAES